MRYCRTQNSVAFAAVILNCHSPLFCMQSVSALVRYSGEDRLPAAGMAVRGAATPLRHPLGMPVSGHPSL